MATDYVTSPITARGKVIFGLGCALLTFLMRMYSGMPEGVSYAILIMNILTPHINEWTKPIPIGGIKSGK
jgi:electron transport complex protein RnfD